MIAILFGLLAFPIAATLSGIIVWSLSRDQTLEDRSLVWQFIFVLVLLVALMFALGRTEMVQFSIDPRLKVIKEMNADALLNTMKDTAPDDYQKLQAALTAIISEGGALPEAYRKARPLLTALTTERLGFADQKAHISWSRSVVDTLKTLQQHDPSLCVALSAGRARAEDLLSIEYSKENEQEFRAAVQEVYRTSHYYLSHEHSPDDQPSVEFNAAAAEWRAAMQPVNERYGNEISESISREIFSTALPARQMCAARIQQLEEMLKRPQALASRLLDSALR